MSALGCEVGLGAASEVMRRHPCFDEEAHRRVGRIHLPVAPRCNIKCAFCERRVCASLTMQHPGWAHRLLTPEEAVEQVSELARSRPGEPFVVGIAGPGEPLANGETFTTLRSIRQELPELLRCISTNGLLLSERLPELLEVGVSALTVTVNAPDGEVGAGIYEWVRLNGEIYRGREAAELLVARQLAGLRAALAAGLAVKVNTVLVPGLNDRHVGRLASQLREIGVPLMNLMPLIPGASLRDHPAPTCQDLRRARLECERAIPQFRRCEHCRADAVRFPRPRANRA